MNGKTQSAEEYYKNKVILVNGASGYIATSLVASLQEIGCKIIRASRTPNRLCKSTGLAEIVDVCADDYSTHFWESHGHVDIVFFLASQTNLYAADDDPLRDMQANVMPMLNLLETSRSNGTKPVIVYAGTVTQQGIAGRLPVDESFQDNPCSTYDTHKLMAEQYLRLYAKNDHVKGVSLRLPNIYGPGQSSDAGRGVLNALVRKSLANEPINIYGGGQHLRDYLYVADAVTAFLACPPRIMSLNGGYFVLGTGDGRTLAQAVELMVGRTSSKSNVSFVPPPESLHPIEFRNFVADSSKFREAAEWRPTVGFDEGLARTIEAFDNRDR